MHVRWGDRRRFWVEVWNSFAGRYEVMKSKEVPEWVRRSATKNEIDSKTPSVRCVRGGGLYFRPDEGEELLPQFRLTNPKWTQAQKMRKSGKRVAMPPQWLYPCGRLPFDHPWANGLILPRFAKTRAFRITAKDVLYDGTPIIAGLAKGITLRDYQQEAVGVAIDKGNGVLCAPCGAGKTAIGVGLIAEAKVKTLVLVHTGDLASQWRDRVEGWLPGVSVGLRGMSKDIDGDVVIATVQTLKNKTFMELYEWSKKFGMVILDEAHHAPAETFVEVMSALACRRRYGLTATPSRADGLTKFLFWTFGDIIWRISHEELEGRGLISVPRVRTMHTTWTSARRGDEYTQAVTDITLDEDRNNMLVDLISSLHNDGRSVLVLSDRVGHCEDLSDLVALRGIRPGCMVGSVPSKRREEIMSLARDGSIRAVFATQLADEGLDIPRLDTVVLATPTSSMSRLEQRCGRIMRPHPGKQSTLVIDIRDPWGPLNGGVRKRDSLYRQLGIIHE